MRRKKSEEYTGRSKRDDWHYLRLSIKSKLAGHARGPSYAWGSRPTLGQTAELWREETQCRALLCDDDGSPVTASQATTVRVLPGCFTDEIATGKTCRLSTHITRGIPIQGFTKNPRTWSRLTALPRLIPGDSERLESDGRHITADDKEYFGPYSREISGKDGPKRLSKYRRELHSMTLDDDSDSDETAAKTARGKSIKLHFVLGKPKSTLHTVKSAWKRKLTFNHRPRTTTTTTVEDKPSAPSRAHSLADALLKSNLYGSAGDQWCPAIAIPTSAGSCAVAEQRCRCSAPFLSPNSIPSRSSTKSSDSSAACRIRSRARLHSRYPSIDSIIGSSDERRKDSGCGCGCETETRQGGDSGCDCSFNLEDRQGDE